MEEREGHNRIKMEPNLQKKNDTRLKIKQNQVKNRPYLKNNIIQNHFITKSEQISTFEIYFTHQL